MVVNGRKNKAKLTLNIVWAFAICLGVSDASLSIPPKPTEAGEMERIIPAKVGIQKINRRHQKTLEDTRRH